MSNPFAITAASNTVLLDKKRQGETSFTATNVSGRPLRGRARLVPQNPAANDWLTLVGEPERNLTIAGTEQFSVRIAVPSTAAAGGYPFRLDVVGVENPDEEFTQGPTVTFQVPEPEVPPKRFPWWIVAAVVAGLVIVGAVFMLLQSQAAARQRAARATATAVAQAGATATAMVASQYNGMWIADSTETGLLLTRIEITNEGAEVLVTAYYDEPQVSIEGQVCTPCSWGPVVAQFSPTTLEASIEIFAETTLELSMAITSDRRILTVDAYGLSGGTPTPTGTYTFHRQPS